MEQCRFEPSTELTGLNQMLVERSIQRSKSLPAHVHQNAPLGTTNLHGDSKSNSTYFHAKNIDSLIFLCGYFLSVRLAQKIIYSDSDNESVKLARPSLVQSWKQGTGGTSGLHRTAQEVTPLHREVRIRATETSRLSSGETGNLCAQQYQVGHR
jgi:hypothetical protein